MYTAVIDPWGTILDQAVPMVKGLLSDADLRKANNYSSDFATIYISVNGHRQWPSMGQPLIHFIATLIGNAREVFIQEMIALRKKQTHAKTTGEDIPKKDWTAKVKWYKSTAQPRAGPPKERVDSLLSTTPIFKAVMTGGEADAKALWPEVAPGTGWSTPSEVAEWQVEVCQCEAIGDLEVSRHWHRIACDYSTSRKSSRGQGLVGPVGKHRHANHQGNRCREWPCSQENASEQRHQGPDQWI